MDGIFSRIITDPPPPLRYDGKITDRPVLPSLLYNDKIVI